MTNDTLIWPFLPFLTYDLAELWRAITSIWKITTENTMRKKNRAELSQRRAREGYNCNDGTVERKRTWGRKRKTNAMHRILNLKWHVYPSLKTTDMRQWLKPLRSNSLKKTDWLRPFIGLCSWQDNSLHSTYTGDITDINDKCRAICVSTSVLNRETKQ